VQGPEMTNKTLAKLIKRKIQINKRYFEKLHANTLKNLEWTSLKADRTYKIQS
jgi:hypothetical protein